MIKKVLAPQVNVNETEATIVVWNVESGAQINVGQTLAVLETDKATLDVEADESGYVYYRRERHSLVSVGELLAVVSGAVLSEAEQNEVFQTPGLKERADSGQAIEEVSIERQSREVTAKAQKLMQRHGLTVDDVPAAEKITVAMVEAVLDARRRNESPSSAAGSSRVPPERSAEPPVPAHLMAMDYPAVKQQEVRVMTASYGQVVLSEVTVAADSRGCDRRLDVLSRRHEFPFTLGDLACYGCSRLLSKYPELNGCFHGGRPYRHRDVNIGYALNLGKGLRVPVVRSADRMDLLEIAQAVRMYMLEYAQDKIGNRQCSNGSFTITDLSSIGVLAFRPVVAPMQSAILGIAVDAASGQTRLILAFDHRMADGLLAGRFLNELKENMEAAADDKESIGSARDSKNHAVDPLGIR